MKKILGLTAMALLLAGPALAQLNTSTITYTLEMGGGYTGGASAYETNLVNLPVYSGGGVGLYNPGVGTKDFNWDVKVAAAGQVDDGTGFGTAVMGVANVVFSLGLYDEAGTTLITQDSAGNAFGAAKLVCTSGVPHVQGDPAAASSGCAPSEVANAAAAGWWSNINDGDSDGVHADDWHLASFIYSMNCSQNSVGHLGRIIDEKAANGPGLSRSQYPSSDGATAGVAAANKMIPIAPDASGATPPRVTKGMLVGMGAGYDSFLAGGSGGTKYAGVGLPGGPTTCLILGDSPIAEGQISMRNMPNGTYTLKLIPGSGNNVLSYFDVCSAGTNGRFATAPSAAAGVTNGSGVKFVYIGAVNPPAPIMTAAASTRTHGNTTTPCANTDYSIPLNLTSGGNCAVEPRNGGPQKIDITYDSNVSGSPAPTVTLSAGTLGAVQVGVPNVNSIRVNLTGVTVAGTVLTVSISGVQKTGGSLPASNTVRVLALRGDVSGDRQVNTTDVAQIKLRSSTLCIDATKFKYDLNCDGLINTTDVAQAKLGSSITVWPCLVP